MAARVPEEGRIHIGGNDYRVEGTISRFPVSQQPGKISLGDYTDETNPIASTWAFIDDQRGGIGVLVMDPRTDADRAWWSTFSQRHKGHMVHQRLTTLTAACSTTADVDVLIDFKSVVYGTYGTAIHAYSNATDSWGSAITAGTGAPLSAIATDWARGLDTASNTDTVAIATGSDVSYSTDGATWTLQNDQAITYLVFFDGYWWGMTAAGALYYSGDLSAAWKADAQLPLPSDYVSGVFVARGPDREQHIYASTKTGLYVHDRANTRFLPTDLELPYHPDGGKGHDVWRGSVYHSAGNSIYQFQAGSDQTIVTTMGPDLRDGLPSDRRGTIRQLHASHTDLLAIIDATGGTGVSNVGTRSSGGMGSSRKSTFGASAGLSEVLGWDQQGWEVKWSAGSSARSITAGLVTYAYSQYRFYWAHNQRVYWQSLPVDVINPTQISTLSFEASASHETPWFDGGISNVNKLALSVFVDSTHPTATDTLKFEYATDLVESYTTIDTKTATGQSEYMLPSAASPVGVTFRYIKFRITGAQGATATNSPDAHKAYLVWRKTVNTLWGARVTLDLTSGGIGGQPDAGMLSNLNTAYNTDTLLEVTWRSDDTGNQNYYMEMVDLQTNETSGRIPVGYAQVTLVEPRQSVSR